MYALIFVVVTSIITFIYYKQRSDKGLLCLFKSLLWVLLTEYVMVALWSFIVTVYNNHPLF